MPWAPWRLLVTLPAALLLSGCDAPEADVTEESASRTEAAIRPVLPIVGAGELQSQLPWLPPPLPGSSEQNPTIINGSKAGPDQFPWMVMLFRGDGGEVVCSGALVHEGWVLTAEHCLKFVIEGDRVEVGSRFPGDDGGQIRRVASEHARGDVGLLALDRPVPDLQTIAIDSPDTALATVVGFGWDEDGNGGVLQYAAIRIVDEEQCDGVDMVGETICAGDDTSTVCFGDSGGPLLNAAASGSRLIGVANAIHPDAQCGLGTGTLRVGGFAAAAAYRSWVDQTIVAGG